MLFAAAALAFTSCVDKYSYESASKPSGEQIFFPGSVGDQIEMAIGDVNFKLPVYRGGKDLEALDVEIEASGEGLDFFTVPGSFSFAEGESQAEITISLIDADSLGLNNFKVLTIAIADSTLATPYGRSKVTIKAGIAPPWNKFDVGVLVETWWGEEEPDKLMEFQQLNDHLRRCRIKDCWGYNTIAGGDEYDVQDYIWYWDTNTDYCYVPLQYMGYTSQYGPTFVADEGSYYNWVWTWSKGTPNYSGSGNVEGTAEWFAFCDARRAVWGPGGDGDYFPYYNGNGVFHLGDFYTAGDPRDKNSLKGTFNSNGNEDFFTGKSFKDYTIDVAYSGMHVDLEGVPYPILNFSGNKKTVSAIYYKLIAQGDDPDEAVDSIVVGTDTTIVKVVLNAGKGISQPLVEPGLYTLVAVPYDPEEVEIEQDEAHPLTPEELEAAKAAAKYKTRYAIAYDFYFPGITSEKKEVEATVVAVHIDEALSPAVIEANGFGRYNSFAFAIIGKDIKAGAFYYDTTEGIEQDAADGYTPEILVTQYADYQFDADDVADANGEGAVFYLTNRKAETSYSVIVYLENSYGENKVYVVEYTTAAVPYTGELVVGAYNIIAGNDTNSVTLAPTATENKFILYDLGVTNNLAWNAVYDPSAHTLTLDGTLNGREANGNYFGKLLGYANQAQTAAYSIDVYSGDFDPATTKKNDTLVINVDATTKKLVSLTKSVAANVYLLADGSYVASLGTYPAATATIVYADVPAGDTVAPKALSRKSLLTRADKAVSVKGSKLNIKRSEAKAAKTVNEGWGGKVQKVSVLSRSYAVPFTSTR